MRKTTASLILACVAIATMSADASAKKPKRLRAHAAANVVLTSDNESIPLTVNRRSWLDPGNAERTTNVGGPSYVSANTIFNKTQDQIQRPDGFGSDVIVGQPYVPGRTQPVVEGSSLPNGGYVVDNVLLPQNYYFNPAAPVPPVLPPAFP